MVNNNNNFLQIGNQNVNNNNNDMINMNNFNQFVSKSAEHSPTIISRNINFNRMYNFNNNNN